MTNPDSSEWAALIALHPMFEAMSEKDIAHLLSDEVSQKHVVGKGETILKQDTLGNSLFVVCEGSVSVMLKGASGDSIELHRAGEGEVLGEMALFGHRLRAATLITAEPCKLLEIAGEEFRILMGKHSDIALYLLAKLSHRLRHTDDLIFSRQIQGLDGSLGELGTQLDVISQTTDAKLVAAQGLFDQTNARTAEMIRSAESRQSMVSYIGGAVAMVLGVFGYAGIEKVQNAIGDTETQLTEVRQQAKDELASISKEVQEKQAIVIAKIGDVEAHVTTVGMQIKEVTRHAEDARTAAGTAAKSATAAASSATSAGSALTNAQASAEEITQIKERVRGYLIEQIIGTNSISLQDSELYIEAIQSSQPALRDKLFNAIHGEILQNGKIEEVEGLLVESLRKIEASDSEEDKYRLAEVATNYFLALITILKDDPNSGWYRNNIARITARTGYDGYRHALFGQSEREFGSLDFIDFVTLAEDEFPNIVPNNLADLYAVLRRGG